MITAWFETFFGHTLGDAVLALIFFSFVGVLMLTAGAVIYFFDHWLK